MTATTHNTNNLVLKIGDGVTPTEGFTAVGQITVSRNCQLTSTTCRITNL